MRTTNKVDVAACTLDGGLCENNRRYSNFLTVTSMS